jgi:RNA methyltransferase, TrmH family
MTITSPHNDHLKQIRKLAARRRARELAGRFVAEGEDLLAAADAAGWEAVERYCAAGSGLGGVEVEPELLAEVSQLGSGTRALAVYEQRWADAPAGPLCVCLHGIADPGNVGAVLRSALAFGASSVALGPDCADPYGPKAVRASMGAVFAVPLARVGAGPARAAGAGGGEPVGAAADDGAAVGAAADDGAAVGAAADDGAAVGAAADDGAAAGAAAAFLAVLPGTTVALDSHEGEPLAAVAARLDGPVTLLVGAERAGLPAELVAAADRTARIPIRSDSLNAAMAATVALYELTRERKGAPGADRRMPTP